MAEISKESKVIVCLILPFIEAAVFCLYWNIFRTFEAVGLGTVNYWTALGIDLSISAIVAAFATAFWSSKVFIDRYYPYAD